MGSSGGIGCRLRIEAKEVEHVGGHPTGPAGADIDVGPVGASPEDQVAETPD
jgi:hypothetical protein